MHDAPAENESGSQSVQVPPGYAPVKIESLDRELELAWKHVMADADTLALDRIEAARRMLSGGTPMGDSRDTEQGEKR